MIPSLSILPRNPYYWFVCVILYFCSFTIFKHFSKSLMNTDCIIPIKISLDSKVQMPFLHNIWILSVTLNRPIFLANLLKAQQTQLKCFWFCFLIFVAMQSWTICMLPQMLECLQTVKCCFLKLKLFMKISNYLKIYFKIAWKVKPFEIFSNSTCAIDT